VSTPLFDGDAPALQTLDVGRDARAHPVRLLYDGAYLLAGELSRFRVFEHNAARPRGHDLYEVGAHHQLLPHGFSRLVATVGGTVHGREDAASEAGRRDDPAAGEHPRSLTQTELYRLP